MTTSLDATDRQILALLQRDARMTNAAVAAKVGLTAPSVFERIRKLEQRGVIQGYTVRVDPAAVDKTLTAFIRLTVAYDERHDSGIQALARDPDILELYSVAGEDCYLVKTRLTNPKQLQALINRMRGQVTVQRSVTMIVLSTIKENAPLNVIEAQEARPGKARAKAGRRRNGA